MKWLLCLVVLFANSCTANYTLLGDYQSDTLYFPLLEINSDGSWKDLPYGECQDARYHQVVDIITLDQSTNTLYRLNWWHLAGYWVLSQINIATGACRSIPFVSPSEAQISYITYDNQNHALWGCASISTDINGTFTNLGGCWKIDTVTGALSNFFAGHLDKVSFSGSFFIDFQANTFYSLVVGPSSFGFASVDMLNNHTTLLLEPSLPAFYYWQLDTKNKAALAYTASAQSVTFMKYDLKKTVSQWTCNFDEPYTLSGMAIHEQEDSIVVMAQSRSLKNYILTFDYKSCSLTPTGLAQLPLNIIISKPQ
eukprot:TRINITY_DN26067_c0_g1_i1.p1 TRINITY_DN26067_c0_g1~~TRINITY_DN26067_c0_g1_i1.p1  ORF type:complete len:310 (-),score=51.13 TRINITY_DN26067_c0_g1_i1:17-946(-)